MDIYICPMCKQENGEHQKYCLNCGTWLVDAKKKETPKKVGSRFGVAIIVLAIIGALWIFSGNESFSNKKAFGKLDVGPFTFSQLEITNGVKSSVAVDLTANKDISDPIEIAAVFYDENQQRIGRATALITNSLSSGQTTTINLKLDEPVNLYHTQNVRIEVTTLSPLQLLERAADKLK